MTMEDVLYDLGRIQQGKLSVRKYVEKLKEVAEKCSWCLNGNSNKKLKVSEILNATKSFNNVVAQALKMESEGLKKKKKKSRNT